jgi:methylase of polypeptide subunit release factors
MSVLEYTGELLYPLTLDPAEALPPDRISEYLGELAFTAVKWADFLHDPAADEPFTARILIPGIGSGIIAAGLLSARTRQISEQRYMAHVPLHIDAYDISEAAVATARHNLEPYLDDDDITLNLYQASWRDAATWQGIAEPYTTVVINPPFLSRERAAQIRAGYDDVPPTALVDTTGDEDGLGEYLHLLPEVALHIAHQPGAAVLGRFAVGTEISSRMQEMLYGIFVDSRRHPTAHINVKSYQYNIWENNDTRRSFSAFLVEPVGMQFETDGEPVNVYQADEFIDPAYRHLIRPAPYATRRRATRDD